MKSELLFGTVGSPLSTPAKPGGTVGGIRRIAELGLDALELAWVRSVRVTPATCEAIRAQAAESDIALSVHAPYFINLNADAEEWPKSRKRILDAAYFGHLAGATDIVIHPGSYFGLTPEETLAKAIPRLKEAAGVLRSDGNPVMLRPEIMGKTALLGTLDDVLHMAEAMDGVLPCVDFAHLHARSGAINRYEEWMAVLAEIASRLGQPALTRMHIHLSGIEYTERGERKHLPFAQADLRYKELLKALRDSGCQGRVMCESPILEQDAVLLQRAWKKIRS